MDGNWKEFSPLVSKDNLKMEANLEPRIADSQILPPPPEEMYQDLKEDNESDNLAQMQQQPNKNNGSVHNNRILKKSYSFNRDSQSYGPVFTGPLERGYMISRQNTDCTLPPPMQPMVNFPCSSSIEKSNPPPMHRNLLLKLASSADVDIYRNASVPTLHVNRSSYPSATYSGHSKHSASLQDDRMQSYESNQPQYCAAPVLLQRSMLFVLKSFTL